MLSRRGPLRVIDYDVDCRGEILDPGARHNDRVAAAVRFLRNPEELAAVVLTEFHVEMFAFDLQLPGLYEVIHRFKKRRSLGRLGGKREADFWLKKAACEYLVDSFRRGRQRRRDGFFAPESAIAK